MAIHMVQEISDEPKIRTLFDLALPEPMRVACESYRCWWMSLPVKQFHPDRSGRMTQVVATHVVDDTPGLRKTVFPYKEVELCKELLDLITDTLLTFITEDPCRSVILLDVENPVVIEQLRHPEKMASIIRAATWIDMDEA